MRLAHGRIAPICLGHAIIPEHHLRSQLDSATAVAWCGRSSCARAQAMRRDYDNRSAGSRALHQRLDQMRAVGRRSVWLGPELDMAHDFVFGNREERDRAVVAYAIAHPNL